MKKYGLLGKKLGHSYSKIIHNLIYEQNNIDASYELIECDNHELKKYIDYLKVGKYSGYNFTIPYKIEIMKYLDEISDEARKIGSVNTICVKNGKTIGYNTDYYGFLLTLDEYNINNINECYILGTGGASKAVYEALKSKGGKPIYVSRNKDGKENVIDYNDLAKIPQIDLLVNTTPVGMYPNVNQMPIDIEVAKRVNRCIDIIFNPLKTMLLTNIKKSYNGLLMLVGQAIKAEEIWNKGINSDYLWIYEKVVQIINE